MQQTIDLPNFGIPVISHKHSKLDIFYGRKKVGFVSPDSLKVKNGKMKFVPIFTTRFKRKYKRADLEAKFSVTIEDYSVTKMSVQLYARF